MSKSKPLPMPIDLVLDSKYLKCSGGTLERAVMIVTARFWAAGCPASGLNAAEACQVAKLTPTAWNRLKNDLMAALENLLPKLAHEHAIAQAKRDAIRNAIAEGAAKGRATMAMRRHIQAFSSSDKKPGLVTPDTATRYVNPRAVMRPDKLAAIGKLPTDKTDAARFSDK
jgi:hypothetical protein